MPNIDMSFGHFLSHVHQPQLIEWLRGLPKPIGIMAVDDTHANDLADACREAQIGVPESVAIIGINNDDLLCESAWPPLSSVECDFTRMGFLAAKTLDRLLNGEEIDADARLIELPPVRVQQRMSSDVLAVDHPDVADAVRFIRKHACDRCTVHDVLRAVPVSRRTLRRQFTNRMGRSLHDEIAQVRLETARQLLMQADLSIDDVARRCGFSTLSSFGRSFHNATGSSPAAHRRQNLNARHAWPTHRRPECVLCMCGQPAAQLRIATATTSARRGNASSGKNGSSTRQPYAPDSAPLSTATRRAAKHRPPLCKQNTRP